MAAAAGRQLKFMPAGDTREGQKMEQVINWLKVVAVAIGAAAGWLWGEVNGVLIALLICVVVDYITGVIVAIQRRELNSAVGFSGLAKKALILILVMLANVVDVFITKTPGVVRTAVCFFYIANEGISIFENCGKLGVPIPKTLVRVFEQLKDRADEDGAATENQGGGDNENH